jgi:sigma-B regulation protein RsbU (phosphoserine phosphatase)
MTAGLEQNKTAIQAATEQLAENFNFSFPDINFIFSTLANHLNINPAIFGATFAFSSHLKNAAPFVFRGENGLEYQDIASKFDYTKALWYDVPVNTGKAIWSVPYFDIGGASEDILLTTYSIPLFNQQDSRLLGVLTSHYLLAKIEMLPCVR